VQLVVGIDELAIFVLEVLDFVAQVIDLGRPDFLD
jgi:hypothetical protein